MRKFNPDAELQKLNTKRKNINSTKLNNVYIPILIVACCCMALIGVTFSTSLVNNSIETHMIELEIVNGDVSRYSKKVVTGAFRDTITSTGTFGSINCSSGNLEYDPITSAITNPYVNEDIKCVISFMDDGVKKISINELNTVYDNSGVSYYYKADAKNNYLMFNNMLFRIIRINGDGTLRIMLNDVVLSSNYGEFNEYYDSNIRKVLEEWFNNNLKGNKYVVDSLYDDFNYVDYDSNSLFNLYGASLYSVGTLSVREAAVMSRDVEKDNFLNTINGFYLMNANGTDNVYYYQNGKILSTNSINILSVRPVINIKNVTLVGTGTNDDPYVIQED